MADRLHLDALAEELTPFRPLSPRLAYAVTALYLLAGGVFVILTLGVRSQYDAGLTDPMFIIRTAILLGLGVASLGAVTAMARPGVGAPPRGWRWALGAALLIPAAALIAALAGLTPAASEIFPRDGKECLAYSVGIGLVLGGGLTV